ncbi:MAG: YDG domain-containing protein [Gallintestinimicrobium sp.]
MTIIVEKAKLRVTGAIATGRTYDGSRLVDVTDVVLENQSDTSYSGVSVDTNGLRGTLEKADAGTYRSVTLPTLTLTGAEADSYELIQPNGPVDLWRGGVTISKKAAPVIQTVDKSYVYTKDVEEAIDLTQYLPADCEKLFQTMEPWIKRYEYYKVLPKINGNILSYTAGKTTPEQMNLGKRGELAIPAQMTNYEDTRSSLRCVCVDQTNVILKPGMEVRLKNNVLTYGSRCRKLILKRQYLRTKPEMSLKARSAGRTAAGYRMPESRWAHGSLNRRIAEYRVGLWIGGYRGQSGNADRRNACQCGRENL